MTCCRRGEMDQRLFRRTEFQSDRSRDGGPGGGGRRIPSTARCSTQPGTESRGCWECQCAAQTAVSPYLHWLAKQTISFVIMISRVIIYTKVAHSPILRRQGSCFSSSGQGENNAFSRVLQMNVGGKKLLFTEKQSGTLCITLPYS